MNKRVKRAITISLSVDTISDCATRPTGNRRLINALITAAG